MKINMKSKKAISKNNLPAAKEVEAKQVKKAKVAVPVKITGKAVALISGIRGTAARSVETGLQGNVLCIRALQNNVGLSITGEWVMLHDGKTITAKSASKEGRIQMGAYANGKNTGATVKLLKESQYPGLAKVGQVKWNVDKDATSCLYIGDVSVKGMVAVKAGNFYWQAEQDSNPNNRHERATVIVGKSK